MSDVSGIGGQDQSNEWKRSFEIGIFILRMTNDDVVRMSRYVTAFQFRYKSILYTFIMMLACLELKHPASLRSSK